MSAEINLSPERALIFRITHIDNVPWILDHGLHCRNSSACDPHFRAIGNPELIAKRRHWEIPLSPGGTLGDYVPFYFTPHTPMLYNIKTGYQGTPRMPMSSIVILASSLHRVLELGGRFVFADRHALLQAAVFSNKLRIWRSLTGGVSGRETSDVMTRILVGSKGIRLRRSSTSPCLWRPFRVWHATGRSRNRRWQSR